MEYIVISESKLKVMLDISELEKRSLQADALDYADPDAKRLFCDILCRAKDELGFDTEGYRVLLQLYPSKDGGCELFITKLGKLADSNDPLPQKDKKPSEKNQKEQKEQKDKRQKNERAFRFESVSHLIGVCKRLCECGACISSSAYVDEEGVWFLIICFEDSVEDGIYDILPICEFSFIGEYGIPENSHTLSLYLGEHAKAVCPKDAIKLLGRL